MVKTAFHIALHSHREVGVEYFTVGEEKRLWNRMWKLNVPPRFKIFCGERVIIFFRPTPTSTAKNYIQTHCVQYMGRPMKQSGMCSRSVPWPETCGRWLKDGCRNMELWCRIFTAWLNSWRKDSQGRKWRLGWRWPGPFGMPETGFALRKNNPSQRTSFKSLQLLYKTTSDGIDIWLNQVKQQGEQW